MKGLHLALSSEDKGQFIFKITPNFFLDVCNLKYVKLLCNLFKISKADVLFNQNKIIFYKEDGTSIAVNANVKNTYAITRNNNSCRVGIEIISNLTEHSKNNGYAHKINQEDFLKNKYTSDCLIYLESYDLDTYQITCQFNYKINEEALVLGHNTNIIKLDRIHEYE